MCDSALRKGAVWRQVCGNASAVSLNRDSPWVKPSRRPSHHAFDNAPTAPASYFTAQFAWPCMAAVDMPLGPPAW